MTDEGQEVNTVSHLGQALSEGLTLTTLLATLERLTPRGRDAALAHEVASGDFAGKRCVVHRTSIHGQSGNVNTPEGWSRPLPGAEFEQVFDSVITLSNSARVGEGGECSLSS